MSASYNSTTRIPGSVRSLTETIILPRQRGSRASRVPAPYQGASYQLSGGKLIGEDRNTSILKFELGVAGCLVKTENFDSGIAGHWWNGNNTQGDTNLRASQCFIIQDIGIDGSKENDVDHVADGFCCQGAGIRINEVRCFNVPGYAILVKPGTGDRAGVPGMYDDFESYISNVRITTCMHGIRLESPDSTVKDAIVDGGVDAITQMSSGGVYDHIHTYGNDRGMIWVNTGTGSNLYIEAARIGSQISASGVHIRGLNIGPGTTYNRGILIENDAASIHDFFGLVRAETGEHPDIAGMEITTGVHHYLQGDLVVLGSSSGIIIGNSHRSFLDLRGSIVSASSQARFVDIQYPVTGWRMTIQGNSTSSAPLLDLSNSDLNNQDGLGNNFRIYCPSSNVATAVLYSGGYEHNLVPGTNVYINDVLQS